VERDVVLPAVAAREAGHEKADDSNGVFQLGTDDTTFRPLSVIKYFDWQYSLRR
jgi:hypothetical protein